MKNLAASAVCVLLVGCGAAAPPPEPASPAEPVSAAAPAPAAAEARKEGQAQGPSVELGQARRQLDIALRQADCTAACRALGSMEKATRRLCALAASPDERDQCRSAETQLATARERVRAACGACGTNVR